MSVPVSVPVPVSVSVSVYRARTVLSSRKKQLLFYRFRKVVFTCGCPFWNPSQCYVIFVVDEMKLGEILLQILQHRSVRTIPPLIHDDFHPPVVLSVTTNKRRL